MPTNLAFFSPINPQRTGISDYSEELLPYLEKLARIDIFIDNYEPSSEAIRSSFKVLPAAEFPARARDYDAIVYQLGNSLPYHAYMMPYLSQYPGIVVLHDYSLSYLILGLTLMRGDTDTLKALLRRTHGEGASEMMRRLFFSHVDPYAISLAQPVIEASQGVIVHNQYARNRLLQDTPGRTVRVIPHATPVYERTPHRAAIRARLGFQRGDFVISSISTVAYNKRTQILIRAMGQALKDCGRLKLLIVGEGHLGSETRSLIDEYQMQDRIVQTGWASGQAYLDLIDAADAIVDLRYPTAGETSGSILRALQAEKPLILSEQGFFLELPDSCCIRIPVKDGEEELVTQAILRLANDPVLSERMGAAARAFVLSELRLEQAAERYFDFIQDVIRTGGDPIVPLPFADRPRTGTKAKLVAAFYGMCRLRYLVPRYGFADTARRVMGKLKSA